MTSKADFQSAEPKDVLVAQVFDKLCQSMLADETDAAVQEQRLWQLPEMVAHFVFNARTEDDRRLVDPIIHRLKSEVGDLINRRIDRSAAKSVLAERIEESRPEFVFRPWRSEDAPRLVLLLNNPKLWQGLPDEYPGLVTLDLANNLISIANGWSARHVVNAVEWRHDVVGQVRLQFDSSPHPDMAEISYWIGEPYWDRGLGTKIVTLYTAECFSRHLDLHRIVALVVEGNTGSMRVLEKAGYRYDSFRYKSITKDGAKHSTHVFGVCRADYGLKPRAQG